MCGAAPFSVSLGAGDDTVIVTGHVHTTLDGGAGDDTFVGGTWNDTFIGGTGTDTVDYRGRPPGSVTAVIGGGPVSGARHEHDDIRIDIEKVLLP
jgi:Ca2+-binding RTX toxin-like protein